MTIVGKWPTDPERKGRRRRLRSLAFVPTLLTLANLICGFAAVHFALRATLVATGDGGLDPLVGFRHPAFLERLLPSALSLGAGMVLLGMILDCFDGLIARVSRSTTNFGGQLDSLADVVTFGVAPATLMVAFMTKELSPDQIIPSPISDSPLGRATWVSAAIYVAFAAVRLARFNVEHAQADFDHRSFRGMPSPGAAAILVSVIMFADQQIFPAARSVLVYSTPILATVIAVLMVSRIPYRRFHRAYLLGRQPFGHLLIIVLVLAVFVSSPAPTLLLGTLWYGVSGPLFWLLRRLRDHRLAPMAHSGHLREETPRKLGS